MAVFRGWRIFIVVALTVLLIVPLYRMRDSPAAASYKEYIYDHLSELVDGVGGYNNTLYHQGTEALVSPQSNFSTPCDNFPNTSGILLVMKTGATESYDKLPTQLLTHMQCLPDFLIFSDLVSSVSHFMRKCFLLHAWLVRRTKKEVGAKNVGGLVAPVEGLKFLFFFLPFDVPGRGVPPDPPTRMAQIRMQEMEEIDAIGLKFGLRSGRLPPARHSTRHARHCPHVTDCEANTRDRSSKLGNITCTTPSARLTRTSRVKRRSLACTRRSGSVPSRKRSAPRTWVADGISTSTSSST